MSEENSDVFTLKTKLVNKWFIKVTGSLDSFPRAVHGYSAAKSPSFKTGMIFDFRGIIM
jgi:hypothetical protein